MKRKNYYLIWCVLFIFLIMPLQFGCEEAEDELQQEQTAISDFDPWIYDFNCNGQIDHVEIKATLDDYTEKKINETELNVFKELLKSLGFKHEENSEKSTYDPVSCDYDFNGNDVIDNAEISMAEYDWVMGTISNTQISLLEWLWVTNTKLYCSNINNAEYYYDIDNGGPNLVPWDIKYKADALPTSPWVCWFSEQGSVSDGILHFPSPGIYAINKSSIDFINGTTEFKLRVEGSGHASVAFCNSNNKYAKLVVYDDKIEVNGLTLSGLNNSSDFHTYRITLTDTKVKVYYDGVLKLEGEPYDNSKSYTISFGTTSSQGDFHSYWDYFYFTDNGAFAPVPALLAKGDGWILLNSDIDWPDYDGETIYGHAYWACKSVGKAALVNYYVEQKLLGHNIVKYLGKNPPGVVGVIKHLLMTLPIAGDADEVKQVWVRESDGTTATKDAGSDYWVTPTYGYFETATLIHHGAEWYDYKLQLKKSRPDGDIPEHIATAILPFQNCGLTSTMLIWDYRLILPPGDLNNPRYVCVYLWRKGAGAPDSEYVHYKTNYLELNPYY